jgi:hypothetical protein
LICRAYQTFSPNKRLYSGCPKHFESRLPQRSVGSSDKDNNAISPILKELSSKNKKEKKEKMKNIRGKGI